MNNFDSESLLVSTLENGIYLLNTDKREVDDSFLSRELMEEFRINQITYTRLLDRGSAGMYLFQGIICPGSQWQAERDHI